MRITRFGHAALLVETDRTRVLIDPGAFSLDACFDLTDLDAIVVTHQHPDHVDPTRIGRLVESNPSARLLAEPQTVASLRGFGVWEATAAEVTYEVGDVTLTGVGFLHAVIHPDIPTIGNVGVLVEHEETRLFHPGDSYASAPLEVDLLAVPLNAPWAKVSETVAFVRSVAPRAMFPIHDSLLTPQAHAMYWARVSELSGVADVHAVAADGTLEV